MGMSYVIDTRTCVRVARGRYVAAHVIEHTKAIKGIDAEIRLQEDAMRFEPGHSGGGGDGGH